MTTTATQTTHTKLTVNLTARATQALNQAAEALGDTRTDTVNRALHMYAAITAAGAGEIVTLTSVDGSTLQLTVNAITGPVS